jgi:SAM-dependent methyltransferase
VSPSETARLVPSFAGLREGFGTAYERYAVGKFLERTRARFGARRIAEWPANGVLGVPGIKSMALALAGCDVTLLHPSADFLGDVEAVWNAAGAPRPRLLCAQPDDDGAAPAGHFDLVWSFCALEHVEDPVAVTRAMLRAGGHVLIFVQNRWAPGVHLHRIQHWLARKPWDHGRISEMSAGALREHVERAGGQVVEVGGCDLPPWPDLNVRLPRRSVDEELLSSPITRRYGPGDPIMTVRAVADAFRSPRAPSFPLKCLLLWHDAAETRVPAGALRWMAHHPYVLAKKRRN